MIRRKEGVKQGEEKVVEGRCQKVRKKEIIWGSIWEEMSPGRRNELR